MIRAVFSPTITLVELQTILDEAQLRIVSGPTEAGVYSLASNSTCPVRESLALLRRHSAVRFAEGTLPEPNQATRHDPLAMLGALFAMASACSSCAGAHRFACARRSSVAVGGPLHHRRGGQCARRLSSRTPAERRAATTRSRTTVATAPRAKPCVPWNASTDCGRSTRGRSGRCKSIAPYCEIPAGADRNQLLAVLSKDSASS